MLDYQLERLNTRSFEQLVQALALEIIGYQVLIFGDGPDGGREATFEGPIKYPEGKKAQWNGYGMVQAKFRQQPDSEAKKNADWAIEQLKAEFKKLKPRPRRKKGSIPGERVCPEYYVFATNLSLSSVAKRGGKDRVKSILDSFKNSHGLKGYAIWDGDQIRRFLDAAPGIRTTYAAWLLPGDVLAEVLRQLKLEHTDFESTIRRYLEAELLDDRYARLSQGGYTEANTIPLSQVFVDLTVGAARPEMISEEPPGASPQGRPTFLALFLEEGRQVLRPSVRVNPMAGRVVLIGGPGQGKTTVGQFCCQLLRAALLRATGATFSPDVKLVLGWIEQQTKELPTVCALRYPLRIDLKALAEALAGGGDIPATSVLDYLVKYISRRTDTVLGKAEFRSWLKAYPWLLVLDGLDEVPASSNRAKVMDAIRDFVSVEAHGQDADLLILATSRPQGYSDEFDRGQYLHLNLAPLSAEEALRYGTRLAEARHPGAMTRVEQLIRSLKRATINPATVRLMESPLQVTIMLALIEGGGEPPEQRWKLFRDYYEVIYRREKERDTPFSSILKKYETDVHWIHHRTGWVLQQRNAVASTTAARLTHGELEKLVDERLLWRGHDDADKRRELVELLRSAATDRLVFLVGNTAKEIGFEIRSLQEFMAAEHCFDGSEACTQVTIKTIAPHAYWRNVLLFAAGRIFFEKESLIDSLIAVCNRMNETLTDAGLGAIGAGSRLAAAMLKDGLARNQPENSRVLARCAARLLDGQDASVTPELAEFFRGDIADVWREELGLRVQAASDGFSHVQWWVCLNLIRIDMQWAENLLRTHFPWRHTEVRHLLLMARDEVGPVPARFWELFLPHIYYHPADIWSNRKLREGASGEGWSEVDQVRGITDIAGIEKTNLLDEKGQPTINSLSHNGRATINKWATLRVPAEAARAGHASWQLLHIASEFAREYTSASLADQIKRIQDALSFDEVKRWASVLPWQLSLSLVVTHTGRPAQEVASAVAAGALGSTTEWDRWDDMSTRGTRIVDLAVHPDPLVVSDDRRGGMFQNSHWLHERGEWSKDFEFVAALTRALPHIHTGNDITTRLINLSCFALNQANSDWSDGLNSIVKGFVESCRDLRLPMSRELIAAITKSSLAPAEKCDLLTTIGSDLSRFSWMPDWKEQAKEVELGCIQVIRVASNTDRLADVLVPLSFLPPMRFASTLPAVTLDNCLRRSEPYQLAALALELNSLRWDKPAEAVVADALRVLKRNPYYLHELLDYIDSQGASGTHLESFVMDLMRSPAPDLDNTIHDRLARLLVKIVERRPAVNKLPDPWDRKPASQAKA